MRSWATPHIEALARGETVQFRPRGRSMDPRIKSGELVTVEPVAIERVEVDDVVLCRVGSRDYLHFVGEVAWGRGDTRVRIRNARGNWNGWTRTVFGRLLRVEP